jgi:hypothetical protein
MGMNPLHFFKFACVLLNNVKNSFMKKQQNFTGLFENPQLYIIYVAKISTLNYLMFKTLAPVVEFSYSKMLSEAWIAPFFEIFLLTKE